MYSQAGSSRSTRPAPNIIFYYHLTASHLATVRKVTGNGVDVACLTADEAVNRDRANGVCLLGISALPYHWDVIKTEALISLVEAVFDVFLRRSPLLSWLRRLYHSSDIDYYFKRVLLNELGQLFSVASVVACPPLASYGAVTLPAGWPGSRLWSVFLNLWREDNSHGQLAANLPQRICSSLDRLTIAGETRQSVAGIVERFAHALYYMARTWYLALRHLRLYAPRLQVYDLLLRTYASDIGINLGEQKRLTNVDFLVNGKELGMEGVAFWVEKGVSEERQRALRRRGYRLMSAGDVVMSPAVFFRRVLRLLIRYTALLPRMVQEDRCWYPHVANLVYYYLIWEEVSHQFKPAAFVAYNDLSPIGVARNIVLRQHGCRSAFYQHTCNSGIGENGSWALNVVYAYLVFDAICSWGPDHSELFQRHPGAIGECWEVGCLWSEHARLVRDDPEIRKRYVDRIEGYAGVKLSAFQRIVGVFDTSHSSMLSCDDMYCFLAGNLELACKMPDVLFLYKPKCPFAEAEPGQPMPLLEAFQFKGRKLWKKICATPNFVVLPWLFETSSVVGLADLTISACFTSTTVEAIGCGKRAIYYDPTDRLPHAFWRRISGMVCVTEEELYNRVCYLLWDCDEETYMNYLRTHCMGIEGHFDGKAITHLRRRLLDVMNSRRSVT